MRANGAAGAGGRLLLHRRAMLCGIAALAGRGAFAREPIIRASAIRWSGAGGRALHGYMAIPQQAHGRQPAVLVIGEAHALPPVADPVARRLVEQLAAGGVLACTADNVVGVADLRASLAWLRFNRYATGKVALAAIGTGVDAAARIVAGDGDIVGACLIVNGGSMRPPSNVPTLAIDWSEDATAVPPAAIAFLKEHLA